MNRTTSKALLACLLSVMLCGTALAQKKSVPLVVEGDTQILVKTLPFKVVAAKGSDIYVWSFPDNVTASETDDGILTVTKAPNGTFTIRVIGMKVDFDTKKVTKDRGVIEVVVGNPTPGPDPDPSPDPDPKPDPAPIPEAGFRVLIVESLKQRIKLPPQQLAILFDKKVRDYLNSKCVVEPDNKTKAWRIWDTEVDATNDLKLWQTAMTRKRTATPWIVISDGKKGFEGPLPDSVDATLELLKKFGG